jgi:hypothetical protein
MGNWTIVIEGVGAHHNTNNPGDANVQAAEFVKSLEKSGQRIRYTSFTFGSVQSLEASPDSNFETQAGIMYEAHRKEVGGKSFSGEPMPTWEAFRSDPEKKAASDVWLTSARALRQR